MENDNVQRTSIGVDSRRVPWGRKLINSEGTMGHVQGA